MKEFKLFLIFLGFLIQNSIQQNFSSSENFLQQFNEDSIKSELKVVKKLSDFRAYVRVSSSNLKSVNVASNLTAILDATLITIDELATLKSHQTFLQISNFSTCDYANIRLPFLDLAMRKSHSIISEIEENVTKIYQNFNQISFNYETNLKSLMNFWTRERTVVNVFKQFLVTLKEYSNYFGILKNNLINFGNFHTFLSEIQNCTKENSTFADVGNLIDENLLKCQINLVDVESQALAKVNAALLTVQSSAPTLRSISTPSAQKLALEKLKNKLKKFSTTDEYPKVSWPRIPDSTGLATGRTMRLRAAQEKKENFKNNWKNHLKNRTNLESDQDDLSQNVQSSRKVRSTNPAIDDILNTTSGVKNQFTTCMQLLNDSIVQIDQMIFDLNVEPTTTASTTTTTRKPFCWGRSDVVNSTGHYLKTACMAPISQTFDGPIGVCTSRLMHVYKINSLTEMNGLVALVGGIGSMGSKFFIDGRWNGSDWIIANPNRTLFSGANPVNGTGDCLIVTKQSSGVFIFRESCTVSLWRICEGNSSSSYFV